MIWRITGYYDDGTSIKYLADTLGDAKIASEKLTNKVGVVSVTIEITERNIWQKVFEFEI